MFETNPPSSWIGRTLTLRCECHVAQDRRPSRQRLSTGLLRICHEAACGLGLLLLRPSNDAAVSLRTFLFLSLRSTESSDG